MKVKKYYLLLFLFTILQGCNNNDECKHQQKVFACDDSTPVIRLNEGETREQIISKFHHQFGDEICFKDLTFGLALNNQLVKTHFKLICPYKTSHKRINPELRILINQEGRVMLNNTILASGSIDLWILNNLPLLENERSYKKEVAILWDPKVPIDYFNSVVLEVVSGFELKFNMIAEDLYQKKYCSLNNEEALKVIDRFPFKITLDLGLMPTPPPPPSLDK